MGQELAGIVYLPVRVRYPVVRPNQIAAEMVREMVSSMSVRGEVSLLVVHGEAALAGQVQPALAELVDWVPAVAGDEALVDRLLQVRQVNVGRGPAGQGLPCPDGTEVQKVTRVVRRGRRVLSRAPPGRFDLGHLVQVVRQVLRVLPGDLGDGLHCGSTFAG